MFEDKKKTEAPEITQVNTPAPVGIEAILQAFLQQSKETAAAHKELANAILEARKPYIDPKVLAAREQARKDREMLVNQELQNRANAKKYCPHVNEGGKPNIKWMQHSNGIILGVCGSCRAEFNATMNPEDAKLLVGDQKSLRWMGRAGEHARKGSAIAQF